MRPLLLYEARTRPKNQGIDVPWMWEPPRSRKWAQSCSLQCGPRVYQHAQWPGTRISAPACRKCHSVLVCARVLCMIFCTIRDSLCNPQDQSGAYSCRVLEASAQCSTQGKGRAEGKVQTDPRNPHQRFVPPCTHASCSSCAFNVSARAQISDPHDSSRSNQMHGVRS